jgi:xylose dehydrogenase (NAD/NADP)
MTPTRGGAIGVGVLGATSRVYTAVIADAVVATPGLVLVHEASRSLPPDPAAASGPRRSDAYEQVLADPDVDLVYVPLPNHLHEPWVLRAAAAGKHVLCEKPLGVDAASAARMADACAAAGVVLAEAYMSPFHPRSAAVQAAVEAGVIGPVQHGEARMSGVLPRGDHRWGVAAGGGALLDVGIYCLEPVLQAMGWQGEDPVAVAAASAEGGDGVDATTSAWVELAGGRTLHLWVSFAAPDQQRLALTGPAGAIEVPVRHATPDRRDDGYDLRHLDGRLERVRTGTGSCYEGLVAHVRDVIRGEAALVRPPSRSIATARLVDRIAAAAGHPRVRADLGGPA